MQLQGSESMDLSQLEMVSSPFRQPLSGEKKQARQLLLQLVSMLENMWESKVQ